ncbi:AAA family ATPase [Stenotrophomonas sp. TWI1183]|uniref:KGGVGR-motif variant AAA ATPase n=1 Tax=Stenotrophomonas sp. TWI1183 TaxID=3136799 RepID=UPI00320A6B01
MDGDASRGRIVTFYSFKGGVGRTMALANLAYLAASHHKKVLVMDWDLEAPGLLYYFRGLSNPEVMETAKHSEGVLNVMWEWYRSVEKLSDSEEMDALIEAFADGARFSQRVHPISDPQAISFAGELHYMGPGSPRVEVGADGSVPYSQALSSFPWQLLFKESAGGVLIKLWRRWAKANYDLVLIDSRTGLADVAGLCTMQMPDEVALCLVLNRQNIDGTGKVAASIREARGNKVGLRAIPMRVARADTSEESDARARALAVLAKSGAFTAEEVTRDFAQLSVSASDNVPFYETLAPFSAQDAALDPLTLNYCRLASAILDEEITPPHIGDDLRMQVRRRQGHDRRSATIDYVNKLAAAEPARTITELSRLVDSAWGFVHDEEALDYRYVAALVELAAELDDPEFEPDIGSVRENLRQLLRRLFNDNPAEWRETYLLLLERLLSSAGGAIDAELSEVGLLEEIDFALSDSSSVDDVVRRLEFRNRAAWMAWYQWSSEDATRHSVEEIQELVRYAEDMDPTPEQTASLAVMMAEMDVLLGEVALKNARPQEALGHFIKATTVAGSNDREWDTASSDARRVAANASMSIALRFNDDLVDPATAAQFALKALDAQPAIVMNAVRFQQLCALFSSPTVSDAQAHAFASRYLEAVHDRPGRGPHAGTLGLRLAFVPQTIEKLRLLTTKLRASQMASIVQAAMRIIDAAAIRSVRLREPSEPISPGVMRLAQEVIARQGPEGTEVLNAAIHSLIERARIFDDARKPKER